MNPATATPLPLMFAASSNAALLTFLFYTLAVFGVAWFSNRLLKTKSFLSEYFLGSRGLGVWAFALTFAATSSSGGSFTGFPSKIYAHGWILALWIGSYMVVPICAMGILGKRLNNVARISGAITVPDVLRDRFESKPFGLLSVGLIVFFMSFNLIAQFKSGSVILNILLQDVEVFKDIKLMMRDHMSTIPLLTDVDPGYFICLIAFGVAVILYTTYGGFHAVVWTDVMQGIVMVLGVLIMLPLALYLVGGLPRATSQMIEMTPPRKATANVIQNSETAPPVHRGEWITMPRPGLDTPRLFRIVKVTGDQVDVLELITTSDVEHVLATSSNRIREDLGLRNIKVEPYGYGADPGQKGVYVTGPGPNPDPKKLDGFLPLSLGISFFFMWAISGTGQPSSMVRLMAFKSTLTLRRSIFTVAIYYSMIYFPLVIIFCCARVLMPGMDAESDSIMPAMAVYLTENIGQGWLAGLLVAAPFAAVMSTVDSFLLMISSGLVRDLYQRNINPQASTKTIKKLSYLSTLLVGLAAMIGAINPPQFLQDIVVYTGSGLAACFLAPVVFAIYSPRSTSIGCISGMLAGFAAHLSLYLAGWFLNGSFFSPYQIMNLDPIVIGLAISFGTTFVATKLSPEPAEHLVRKYFMKRAGSLSNS